MLPAPASRPPDYLRVLLYTVLIGVVLYVGQTLLVPLSFAILISFVLYPICKWLEAHKVPRSLAIGLCLLLLLVLLAGLVVLLIQQFLQFTEEWPMLQTKLFGLLNSFSQFLSEQLNVTLEKQTTWLENMLMSGAQQFIPVARQVLYSSAVGLVMLILIPFYAALILYYREQLAASLISFFPDTQNNKIRIILQQTITTYYNFIKGMAIVYLVVGVLNVVGLLIIGIPHALLFGIVASLLTFIPYVGITLGSLLPITVAWLTFDSVWYPLGVVAVFTFVQYLEANVIFPVAVSYRLQVNTLFMILAIIAGGIIWGAAGMILFVPFLAIVKLVADKTEGMETISQLLGIGTKTKMETKKPQQLY
ncbi:MAG: AI-2E family transporter [Hymenobacteraceae bacterium]|nr:AI-2E family transporter [Hymenobacteraceae bacterium]MDX5396169.1 AI-2E family transporter [Hymenobacteraceae bacterium]MDX5443256.1 AI-2E family transporter [Hymenobacteraceae bacterium]MDX5512230.1 AI-2E family transporter [Hymenobacteraceae bacterium]